MKEEELVSLMNEARMISASENVLYPMIATKINQRLELACSEFRGGDTRNLIAHIGYIVGLKDLLNSLKSVQTAGNRATIKLIDENK